MKKELRERFLSKRNLLSKLEVFDKSNEIKEKLLELPEFIEAKTIMSYISFRNEARTHELIKESIKKNKRIVIPITDFKKKKIYLSEVRDFEKELISSRIGLFQPKREFLRPVNEKELELIIVPGIAFDEKGCRIGFGKGYYDSFLKKVKKSVPVIALAFENQISNKKLPSKKHDKHAHKIITEKRV
ncbi:5-formyltetrahydrofolate cyclo-ligase, partial [Candidatus Micrarchaeota archaeon]|nr:5-formyltetrahydrofolate cyclo-ligase [Candidatus Micrarchaeota archaeon]